MQFSRRSAIKKSGIAAASLFTLSSIDFSEVLAKEEPSSVGNAPGIFPVREIYCPAHFGNSYEAMWPREMKAYLAELKWWGFNRYSDWITSTDIRNPYTSDATWDLGREQLERKKKAFRAAQDLGMELNVILTPNHVYLDQVRPELTATKNKKIFGQLLCPSLPEGRKQILGNAELLFRDLAENGLQFAAWTGFAYDYGGCACPKCSPWILTFARLAKEIQEIAKRYHPKIEPWFCSWWWTPEEHEQFNKWAKEEAPGWLKGMTLHLEYEQTRFKDVTVPDGCRKIAFVHNGYADTKRFNDIYAKCGATIAPNRIPKTLQDITIQGAAGYQAYSEGVFEDVNKAILGGLSSGKFPDAKAALKAYAQRYFAASGTKADRWANWLTAWGNRKNVQLPEAAAEFEKLSDGAPLTWRLEHWRSKLKLEAFDRSIGLPKGNEWTPDKLKLADDYWAEIEHLQRDIYKLGPLRHVFGQKFLPPAWYDSWQKATQVAPVKAAIEPEA